MAPVGLDWLKRRVEGLPTGPGEEKAEQRAIEELVEQQREQGSEIGELRRELLALRELVEERCPKGEIAGLQRTMGELRGEAKGRTLFWSLVTAVVVGAVSICGTMCFHWADRANLAEREAGVAEREARAARLEAEKDREVARTVRSSVPQTSPHQPTAVELPPDGPALRPATPKR